MILEHEKVHVGQRHWNDLLLVETATLVLWFNPVVFLYKRSFKLQHEHLADARVAGDPALVAPTSHALTLPVRSPLRCRYLKYKPFRCP
ncbi:MAG: hypothetical protein LBU80_06335 [Rikenellaceae bacterium]|nr:hypothetical protein [Rikenellaceae bacterium]